MRLDHIAFRVNSKDRAKNLLSQLLGYTIKQPFEIFFEDGSAVECFALKPPEDISKKLNHKLFPVVGYATAHYHMAPEIFDNISFIFVPISSIPSGPKTCI